MGHVITIQCKNCGHEQRVTMGVGLRDASLEHVIHLVPEADRPAVLEILHDHHVEHVLYEHALFVCPDCHALEGHFYYGLMFDGGQRLESQYDCARCGSRLERATQRANAYQCPSCGQTALTEKVIFWWD